MRAKQLTRRHSTILPVSKVVRRRRPPSEEVEPGMRACRGVVYLVRHTRAGWDAAFARMRRRGDDRVLDSHAVGLPTEWERKGWTWAHGVADR